MEKYNFIIEIFGVKRGGKIKASSKGHAKEIIGNAVLKQMKFVKLIKDEDDLSEVDIKAAREFFDKIIGSIK